MFSAHLLAMDTVMKLLCVVKDIGNLTRPQGFTAFFFDFQTTWHKEGEGNGTQHHHTEARTGISRSACGANSLVWKSCFGECSCGDLF